MRLLCCVWWVAPFNCPIADLPFNKGPLPFLFHFSIADLFVAMEERDSPRSRSRDRDDQSYDEERPEREDNPHHATVVDNNENFNLYITNLSFEVGFSFSHKPYTSYYYFCFILDQQTTDEILRAAFEPYGTVDHAAVIKQPVTKISR